MDAGIGQFIPLILIFVIFYFFLIRPQQKKVKEHKAMVESLKRGDKIITSGGIVGTVERVIDNEKVEVSISENVNVEITVNRTSTPESVIQGYSSEQPAQNSETGWSIASKVITEQATPKPAAIQSAAESSLRTNLNRDFTFDSFVEGKSNQLAFAAATGGFFTIN